MVGDSVDLCDRDRVMITIRSTPRRLHRPHRGAPNDRYNVDENVYTAGSGFTSADAAITLRIAVSGEYVPEADIDENGCVTSLDARMIMQAAAGRIEL